MTEQDASTGGRDPPTSGTLPRTTVYRPPRLQGAATMRMIEVSTSPARRHLRPCTQCGQITAWLRDDRTNAVTQITADPVPNGPVVICARGTAYHPTASMDLESDVPRYDYHSRTCGPVHRPAPAPRLADLKA